MPMDTNTMATLRRYIAEPDESVYTNAALNTMFDANGGDVNVTAAEVWSDKAAKAAILVDTAEGASSRKNSQVYTQAVQQASYFRAGSAETAATASRSATTRAIVRP